MGNRKKLHNLIYDMVSKEDINIIKNHRTYDIATNVLGLGYFQNIQDLFKSCGYKISSMSDTQRWNRLIREIEKCVDELVKESE